jgi:hypothetical protein
VPVLVNPVVMKDTMADVKLGMEILVGPDELELAKKKKGQALVQEPGKEANLDNVKKPVQHKPWPPAAAPSLPLKGMNGDTVTLDEPKSKKPKASGSEPSAAKEADAAAAKAAEEKK